MSMGGVTELEKATKIHHKGNEAAMQLRILLSYYYYKNVDLDDLFARYFKPPYPDIFADSGGFSAKTQGVTLSVQEYAAWVKRWQHLFTTYANLDVIGSADKTWENQQSLELMGLKPLPVFHTGEKWERLEHYIERYPYIALGGMVPYMRFPKKVMPWIIQCFKLAKDKSVFHGFGATSWIIIRDLPWYSVDSSSWGAGFRFGGVPLFDTAHGRFVQARLGDKNSCYRYRQLFHEYGFEADDFADRSRNDRMKICAISALSYMKAEQWLQRRHGEVHIPSQDANVDPHLHLVTTDNPSSNHSVDTLAKSLQYPPSGGVHLHLADANISNLAHADVGLKLYLQDATPASSFDIGKVNRELNG